MPSSPFPFYLHVLPSSSLTRPPHRAVSGRLLCRGLVLAVLLAATASTRTHAQYTGGGAVPTQNHLSTKPNDTSMPLKDASGTEDQRMLQMRNAARQLSMLSDAGKLLRLANELHDEIGKTNSAILTPAQLRKIQQIEKLAHKVRLEMAISLSDSQGGLMPIQTLGPQ